MTVDGDKSADTNVDEGHDIRHVTAVHRNLYRNEIQRRNVRDKLRVEIERADHRRQGHMSAMAKLTGEIEESTSDVIDYGLASHPMTLSQGKLWRAMHLSSLGQLIVGCKVTARVRREGWLHEEVDEIDS